MRSSIHGVANGACSPRIHVHSPSRRPVYVLLLFVCLLAGCASPAGRLQDIAARHDFASERLRANGFDMAIFSNVAYRTKAPMAGAEQRRDDVLHVYLEGDGEPWKWKVLVMPDPTPRRPLMLGLMALDPLPSVYVGRPCYNGRARDAGCSDTLWTSERYSETVIASMTDAVRALAVRRGATSLRLFGHSGGGTLAMLIAARLPATRDVVTVAGNLDPDAWTRHHGYLMLRGSLNPASEPALGAHIRQWHLLGGADRVVPPQIVRPYIEAQASAMGVDFPTFTHGCCWRRVWPDLLKAVIEDDPERLPGSIFRLAEPRASIPDDR